MYETESVEEKNRKKRKKKDHLDDIMRIEFSGKRWKENRDMSSNKRTENGSLYFAMWMLLCIFGRAVSMTVGKARA